MLSGRVRLAVDRFSRQTIVTAANNWATVSLFSSNTMPAPSKNKKLSRKQKQINHVTRLEELSKKEIHPGSYAHPELQKLLGIEIPDIDPSEKTSKKKVCLLLGYIGENYSGFQLNESVKTLQAEIELVLYKVGAIQKLNFGYPYKYAWSTSGRTDKGVHAAAQVVSCKLEFKPDQTMDDLRTVINDSLPDEIRVLDIVKVTKGFNAKTSRNKVRYRYMVPSFCLMGNIEEIDYPNNGCRPGSPVSDTEMIRVLPDLRKARVTSDMLEAFRTNLASYQGTKSYHNFTRRLLHMDASAKRFIMSFEAEEPVVHQGIEWIPTVVVGQSFLLNQIRKMITHAILTTRKVCQFEDGFTETFYIRSSPAEGLFLDMTHYDFYNGKVEKSNSDCVLLDWTKTDTDVYQRWKDFKDRIVMHVMEEEEDEHNFVQFLYAQEYMRRFPPQWDLESEAALAGDQTAEE